MSALRRIVSVGAVCLAVALSPTGAGVATAASGLPPIGAEIPTSMLAVRSQLEYNGKTYALDFRGGMRQRVDVNPDDPITSVRLRTIGFRVSAEIQGGGTVTLEQYDIDIDSKSTVKLVQRFPPKYVEHDEFSITAEIALPDQKQRQLVSKTPMVLTAVSLRQYPPRGDSYELKNPVELVDPGEPDTVVSRLTAFPAKRGAL